MYILFNILNFPANFIFTTFALNLHTFYKSKCYINNIN